MLLSGLLDASHTATGALFDVQGTESPRSSRQTQGKGTGRYILLPLRAVHASMHALQYPAWDTAVALRTPF